jgi:DNA-directed RNA polymerase subunit RPC12/RpoP
MTFKCSNCGMVMEVLPVASIVACPCGHRKFWTPDTSQGLHPTPRASGFPIASSAYQRPTLNFAEQMREWAAGNGVTPIQPRDTSRDSRLAFGRASDDVDRREFYAGWRAYDEALERMPERQRILQQRAEVLELERQFAL